VRQVLWLDEFEPHRPFLVQRTISPAGLIRTSMLGELVPTAWDESFHTVWNVCVRDVDGGTNDQALALCISLLPM
jgi:hypothetical protein